MNMNKRYRIITVEELFHIMCDMEYIDEIAFTADNNLDFEPSGWYGIKKLNIFDSDRYVIGYYGGFQSAILDAVDFGMDDLTHALKEVLSFEGYDGEHICIDLGEEE